MNNTGISFPSWGPVLAASALVLAPTAASAQGDAGYERDDSRYLYHLTAETAARCAVLQDEFSVRQQEAKPEWARRHKAMALTWRQLVRELAPDNEALGKQSVTRDQKLAKELDASDDPLGVLANRSRICDITAAVHSGDYNGATFAIKKQNAALFADFAAKKNQSGLDEFPEPPTKKITFGDWTFEASGNSCRATRILGDGAILTLGFTNFFDGSLKFEWDGLPKLDGQSEEGEEEYETMMGKHRAGFDTDDDFTPVIADGFTFATYPGTAFFADETLVASPFGDSLSDGQKYYFGPHVQANYYNLLPLGKELVIKVLGEETHRVPMNDPAMWNEMSNCMAQYPYG